MGSAALISHMKATLRTWKNAKRQWWLYKTFCWGSYI